MFVALHKLGASGEHLDHLAIAPRRFGGYCQPRIGSQVAARLGEVSARERLRDINPVSVMQQQLPGLMVDVLLALARRGGELLPETGPHGADHRHKVITSEQITQSRCHVRPLPQELLGLIELQNRTRARRAAAKLAQQPGRAGRASQ